MPQLRSRLPSPLGPRRAGASRQRAPGPPGRVYKPPRPPASERASERARRELCPRGKGSAPCSGRIPTLCVSLAAQTQRARHGGESGSQGPPDCLPACLPLARGEAAPPPASPPAGGCLLASEPGWMGKEGPSELPRRPAELQIRARAGASARSPGREAAQSALGEGASPSRSRLLAFAPGKEGRKEQAGCGGVGVWET